LLRLRLRHGTLLGMRRHPHTSDVAFPCVLKPLSNTPAHARFEPWESNGWEHAHSNISKTIPQKRSNFVCVCAVVRGGKREARGCGVCCGTPCAGLPVAVLEAVGPHGAGSCARARRERRRHWYGGRGRPPGACHITAASPSSNVGSLREHPPIGWSPTYGLPRLRGDAP
jgi:hypothetical protein